MSQGREYVERLSVRRPTDANPRLDLAITGAGAPQIAWGDGTAAPDVFDTRLAARARLFDNGAGDGAVQEYAGFDVLPAVSAANRGRLLYDRSDQRWKISENTGPYRPILTGSASKASPYYRGYRWQQNPGATGIVEVGTATVMSEIGMKTVINDGTAGNEGQYINYASTPAILSEAGILSPVFNFTQRQQLPVARGTIEMGPVITSIRGWWGFCSGDPMAATDPAGLHLAAFRFDTGVDGITFRAVTKDGVTINVVATGVIVVAAGRVEWEVDMTTTGQVNFYLQENLVATTALNLPGAATLVGLVSRVRALVAGGRSTRFSKIEVESS